MSRFPFLALVALVACGGEELVPGAYAQGEPIRIAGGQFFKGDLPGQPPDTKPTPGVPVVTSIDFKSNFVQPDQSSKSLGGRVTDPAVSVGMRLEDMGSGYWVVPIGPLDPQFPGEHTFGSTASFLPDIPPGNHYLLSVGFGADGTPGIQQRSRFCFVSTVPDLGHSCDPEEVAPPAFVVQLSWGQPVDLDLEVRTPSGRLVTSKDPYVLPPVRVDDFTAPKVDASGGYIDRDGGRLCSTDPLDRESLVFPVKPEPGVYSFYANLFDACGQPGVTFQLHVYRWEGSGADAKRVEVTDAQTIGQLTSTDANGGATDGVHLVDVTF